MGTSGIGFQGEFVSDHIQFVVSEYLVSIVSSLWNLVYQEHVSYQTPVASKSWLLFLKGVREGSPSRKLAIILPANIDIIDENHKASGCFREKAIAPEIKMKELSIFIDISLKVSQYNHLKFHCIAIQ